MALGTAGAIKNCEDLIDSDKILVLNGDILTNINLNELYKYYDSDITIALAKVEDASSFGVAQLDKDSNITNFIEKPKDNAYGNLINAGIYVIHKNVIKEMPKDQYLMFETDVFPKYVANKKLKGYTDDFYWLDIGTHERYEQANMDVLENKFIL